MDDDDSLLYDDDDGDEDALLQADHGTEERRDTSGSDEEGSGVAEARKEIKLMNIVRAMVILILLTIAFVGAETVYVVSLSKEASNFQTSFQDDASTLIAAFYTDIDEKLLVAETLASQFASGPSSGGGEQQRWPYVTFSDFDARVSASLELAKAASIGLAPLVMGKDRDEWEIYATEVYPTTLYNDEAGADQNPWSGGVDYFDTNRTVNQGIYVFDQGVAETATAKVDPYYFPLWQTTISTNDQMTLNGTLFNLQSNWARQQGIQSMIASTSCSISSFLYKDTNDTDMATYSDPRSCIYYPIHTTSNAKSGGGSVANLIVAAVDLEFKWMTIFDSLSLTTTSNSNSNTSLVVVVENSCGANFSFSVTANSATDFMGPSDLHDSSVVDYTPIQSSYDDFAALFDAHSSSVQGDGNEDQADDHSCTDYRITVYPSQDYKDSFYTAWPTINRFIFLGLFLLVVVIFFMYDCLVEDRQKRVVESAQQSDAIVRSLFPALVRRRLYKNAMKGKTTSAWTADQNSHQPPSTTFMVETPKTKFRRLLMSTPASKTGSGGGTTQDSSTDKNSWAMSAGMADHMEPIADFFPSCTILFADIAGFTGTARVLDQLAACPFRVLLTPDVFYHKAWSSEREPAQVFFLLESIYQCLDRAAKRLRVFKVETVGDCYVAATGIPNPMNNHAVVMARFARICLVRVSALTKELEAHLGPGTGDLAFRIGIHSGSATAGVLRGQKARCVYNSAGERFQIFGDTMNTAARMESTGMKGRVQISAETAKLLIEAGKQTWITSRQDIVAVKGKGDHQTFWLTFRGGSSKTHSSSENDNENVPHPQRLPAISETATTKWAGTELEGVLGVTDIDEKMDRLIDWNTDCLMSLLERVIAVSSTPRGKSVEATIEQSMEPRSSSTTVLEELQMVIRLPCYNPEKSYKAASQDVVVSTTVADELREYVAAIASGYQKNAFHNFEHCSHVMLSAQKLLKRIVEGDALHQSWSDSCPKSVTTEDLHNHTYGIASDPLTQFAIVFSALIHDVGHKGVPNGRLSEEEPDLANRYKNQCVAEQWSVDIAFDLLMMPQFENLRGCIYGSQEERKRFRALVVNSVISTDIFNKDLKALRNSRWEIAFHEEKYDEEARDRKATIIIEHVIQASDVAHTMQHWNVYVKWNERLFKEMYFAFLNQRSSKNPADGWYEGELWFFDNYVIPLAGKLRECGVFGVSSDEYLNYALQNREEWERNGKEEVQKMLTSTEKAARKMGLLRQREDSLGMSTDSKNAPSTPMTRDLSPTVDTDRVASAGRQVPHDFLTYEVTVPPGVLGITIEVEEGHSPKVCRTDPASPLKHCVGKGDVILAIDEMDTQSMSATACIELLGVTSQYPRRLLMRKASPPSSAFSI